MTQILTEHIVNHIFSNLLIINSSQFDRDKYKSIRSEDHLLLKSMVFEDETGQELHRNIWGVQLTIENQNLKLLLADCSVDSSTQEYALLVYLPDSPSYAVYSAYSNDSSNRVNSDVLIAASLDGQNWMKCNMYLQAMFLAGMEQIKDVPYRMSKCQEYSKEYDLLKSFVKYHGAIYESSE